MSKPRYDINALKQVHEMDLDRRTLFVEGNDDRSFLEYLVGDEICDDTLICEISSVDIPKLNIGGEKGRIIYLSDCLNDTDLNIHFFMDSDFHRILNKSSSARVTLTDYKDLEGYLYKKSYFDKYIKLGLKTKKIKTDKLWCEFCSLRDIGFLRLCSEIHGFDLPFQRINSNIHKYFKVNDDFSTTLNMEKYISILFLESKRKNTLEYLKEKLEEVKADYASLSEREIIHGKDFLFFLKEFSNKIIKTKENVDNVFWMSFEKESYVEYKNLKHVINLLKA